VPAGLVELVEVLTRMPKLRTTAFAERGHYSHDEQALERAGISTDGVQRR